MKSPNLAFCRLGFVMLLALALGTVRATPLADPSMRPATPSPVASRALLTGVARAGDRLVAVGERGVILSSDDHGRTWVQVPAPVSVTLTAVRFASSKVGWAVGHSGVVLRTGDGGRSWVKQLQGAKAADLLLADAKRRAQSAPADPELQQQVVEAERMVRDGADKPFLDLLATSELDCLIVGAYGLAVRTFDGGTTWLPWKARIPNPQGGHLYGVQAVGKTVYIAGEMGLVYRSVDGGQQFQALKTPYAGSYFGIVATSADRAIAYGLRGNALATEDGGGTWRRIDLGLDASLTGALQLGSGALVLSSQSGKLLSYDAPSGRFRPLSSSRAEPIVGMVEAADGSLVVVGARGAHRIASNSIGVVSAR